MQTSPFVETVMRPALIVDKAVKAANGDIEGAICKLIERGFFNSSFKDFPEYIRGTMLDNSEAALVAQKLAGEGKKYPMTGGLENFIMMTSDDLDLIAVDKTLSMIEVNSDGIRANKHQPQSELDLMLSYSRDISDDWLLYNPSFKLNWEANEHYDVILKAEESRYRQYDHIRASILKSPCLDMNLMNAILINDSSLFGYMLSNNNSITSELIFGATKMLYLEQGREEHLMHLLNTFKFLDSPQDKIAVMKFCFERFGSENTLDSLKYQGHNKCLEWIIPELDLNGLSQEYIKSMLEEALSSEIEDIPTLEEVILKYSNT